MSNRSRIMPILLVLLTTLAIVQLSIAITSVSPSYEWFDPLIDVRGALVDRHAKQPDETEMQQAAIEAMVESLDDPYALFVPDNMEEVFIKELEGDYAGIGARVNLVDGELIIVTPMDNSPALEAGIKAGDVVEFIDGTPATDTNIQNLIDLLTGPPGTDVLVSVRHKDETKEDITITRSQIQSPSVTGFVRRNKQWSWCLDDANGICYVQIEQFNDRTPEELATALQLANEEVPIRGLIIDLRDNPGGALSAAITISNMFLNQGTIVTVTGRADPQRSWNAEEDHILHDIPVLLLVNSHSASASEIVAGSLQANGRVVILGTRTFGKGSVQEVIELESGGILKFTSARYDLANGRTIDKKLSEDKTLWGVDPDAGLVIPETQDEHVQRLKNRDPYTIITDDEPEAFKCGDIDWIDNTIGDHQLAQALIAMQTKLTEGKWPQLTDDKPVVRGLQENVKELAKVRIELIKQLNNIQKELNSMQIELEKKSVSLLPSDANLKDALITITDNDGNSIGAWRIKDGNVQDALETLRLEPEEQTND